MKSEYLRHEYTWSNHCITGNVLGWGMTASSCPKDRRVLRELEKTASAAEPDRKGDVIVEELSYSPVCGFVKMAVAPTDSGEDNRKNKKVYMYQPSGEGVDWPEVYLAPGGIWRDEGETEYIAPVRMDAITLTPENIFIKMNVYDRLPDFLQVVFWCLFDKKQGLNIVAPSWDEEDFAANAREVMFAIHSILPPSLRKRAGYVSYTEQPISREPFY
ncbi:MAG: hypothetical protein LUF92_12705, partial [Clostridiales bacterium]|nr:hypothetical protein [Clostridiales bacterium]